MAKDLLKSKITKSINDLFPTIDSPELVFGIVGPIGVDVGQIVDLLQNKLHDLKYKSHVIHLTKVMDFYISDSKINHEVDNISYYKRYLSLIEHANKFRKIAKHKAAMAGIAIHQIRSIRKTVSGSEEMPALSNSYIIRQFKRAEEIQLMRQTYGRKFIQISVYGSPIDRRRILISHIQSYDHSPKSESECERQAIDLIDKDHSQVDDENGQRLSEVFHLGDLFVDGISRPKAEKTISRFLDAFFGLNLSSPTKDEYGLYIAAAASLRSVDLSRQVGAATFSKDGEVISLGCNEVPKAGGGTYWIDQDSPIWRDIELGGDPNQERKNEIVFDLVERMSKEKLLAINPTTSIREVVDLLLKNKRIKDAQIMDIIEFGRIIHAEMSALMDAARTGRSVKGATLFCTTFPCHMCAKHIVASGVDRVVFLEPYPKSYAQKLHSDAITFNAEENGKVLFEPFIGISPRRYRDIFEKKKRKDNRGAALKWYESTPKPLIEDKSAAYIDNEEPAIYTSLKELRYLG
ncbi:MAG: deoxycytidylate deaminase [Chelatococcus sp.]|nr:MAG: deoxycytidylate deaminase [Chelatococcus sp.]